MKMFKDDMLHLVLPQMFKMVLLCMNASLETSSPFCQLPHQQLTLIFQGKMHSDTAAVVPFKIKFKTKSFKVVFFYPFIANSFTSLLAVKPLNSYRLKK